MDRRLDGIDRRLDEVDRRLDGVDGRLGRIDGRLDGITIDLKELLRRTAPQRARATARRTKR
jgi:hypothetical protein